MLGLRATSPAGSCMHAQLTHTCEGGIGIYMITANICRPAAMHSTYVRSTVCTLRICISALRSHHARFMATAHGSRCAPSIWVFRRHGHVHGFPHVFWPLSSLSHALAQVALRVCRSAVAHIS